MTDATELDTTAIRARISDYLATWEPFRGGRSLDTHGGKHLFLSDVRVMFAALSEVCDWRAASGDPTPAHARATNAELRASMNELARQRDEADRWATWGALDPPDVCMCTECVLAASDRADQ